MVSGSDRPPNVLRHRLAALAPGAETLWTKNNEEKRPQYIIHAHKHIPASGGSK